MGILPDPHLKQSYDWQNTDSASRFSISITQKQKNPAIPATKELKCRCIKGGTCSTIGIYPATIVLQSCYHPTPGQRLFFERIENGYRRSVVWLEPFSRLAIAERLKGRT